MYLIKYILWIQISGFCTCEQDLGNTDYGYRYNYIFYVHPILFILQWTSADSHLFDFMTKRFIYLDIGHVDYF